MLSDDWTKNHSKNWEGLARLAKGFGLYRKTGSAFALPAVSLIRRPVRHRCLASQTRCRLCLCSRS